jgi:hypothetical protein|tara:strand:- start:313 stop:459 length:147 start_codon:yes stop_codon:yes gene_type:complete
VFGSLVDGVHFKQQMEHYIGTEKNKLKKMKKKLDTYRFLLVYLGINNE